MIHLNNSERDYMRWGKSTAQSLRGVGVMQLDLVCFCVNRAGAEL